MCAAPPSPSPAYTAAALAPSLTLTTPVDAPVLILDPEGVLLNHTTKSVKKKNRIPPQLRVRPYLSTFLEYVSGTDASTGRPRFRTIVLSPLQPPDLFPLLSSIDLVPVAKSDDYIAARSSGGSSAQPTRYRPRATDGDVLAAAVSFTSLEDPSPAPVQTELDELCGFLDRRGLLKLGGDAAARRGAAGSSESGSENDTSREIAQRSIVFGGSARKMRQYPFNHHVLFRQLTTPPPKPPIAAPRPASTQPPLRPLWLRCRSSIAQQQLTLRRPQSTRRDLPPRASSTRDDIASATKSGIVKAVRDRIEREAAAPLNARQIDEVLAGWGEKVCKDLEIEVSRAWRPQWRTSMLEVASRRHHAAVEVPIRPSPSLPPRYAPARDLLVEKKKAFKKLHKENLPPGSAKALKRLSKSQRKERAEQKEEAFREFTADLDAQTWAAYEDEAEGKFFGKGTRR